MSFAWDAYLPRVGLSTPPPANESGLRQLHEAQFFHIPFENFDIQLGRGISLDPNRVFDKLVNHRRGGYCFELNGLLLRALQAAGFTARPILARVHLDPQPSGLTHQMSLVQINDRPWLMDVGFGAGGLRCPLPVEIGHTAEESGWGFRLVADEKWGTMMQSLEKGIWKDSYSFDGSQICEADIAVGNHYTSTSPMSHFVTARKASAPRKNGRVSLLDFDLTTIEDGTKTVSQVASGQAYLELLAELFNIDLAVPYESLDEVL